MHTSNATSHNNATTSGPFDKLRRVLLRKLWLPRGLYEALPYLYTLAGVGALGAALYLPGWTWILPYLVLLGLICLHAGVALITLRLRFRRSQGGPPRSSN